MNQSQAKTILIVDDEPGYQKMIAFGLSGYEFNILTANNGHQALEMLENNKVDLVITDMKMPKMDGMELVIAIKETNPDLPIILMTGFEAEEKVQKALGLKVTAYLRKPFDINILKNKVKKEMSK